MDSIVTEPLLMRRGNCRRVPSSPICEQYLTESNDGTMGLAERQVDGAFCRPKINPCVD